MSIEEIKERYSKRGPPRPAKINKRPPAERILVNLPG
jgi:hypothetical protein